MSAGMRVAGAICLGVMSACARNGFADQEGRVDEAEVVASGGESPAAKCSWAGGPVLESVRPLSELNTSESERDPFLSQDGRTFYFFSGTTLNVASREHDGTFTAAAPFTKLGAATQVSRLEVSADGLFAVTTMVMSGAPDVFTASQLRPAQPVLRADGAEHVGVGALRRPRTPPALRRSGTPRAAAATSRSAARRCCRSWPGLRWWSLS